MLQSDLNIRLQDTELVAHIVPNALVINGDHTVALRQRFHSVRQLQLIAGSLRRMLQDLKDLRRHNHPAEDEK